MCLKVNITNNFFNCGCGCHEKNGGRPDFTLNCKFNAGNEIVVLFGRSGAGKTTMLQCIAGLTKPDSGSIRMNNRIYFDSGSGINMSPQKRRVGYVFQNITLFPHMDVKQNVAFGLKGLSQNEKEARIREVMELVQIEELGSYYPPQLSGGQKQRVVLARALAVDPDILLLDEPFSALDTIVRMHLREEIKDIQKTLNIPVLFITHNPVEAFTMADKVAVFYEGNVQQFGTPEDVFYYPETKHVAKLVGFSNLFDGALIDGYDAYSKDVLLRFEDLTLVAPYTDRKPGEKVTWGVRPENVQICRAGDPEKEKPNIFAGVIKSIANKGASQLVYLKLDGSRSMMVAEMTNHMFSAMELGVGDRCMVHLEVVDIVIF